MIGWTDRQSNLVVEVALRLKTTHCDTEYLVNLTKPNRSGPTGMAGTNKNNFLSSSAPLVATLELDTTESMIKHKS